MTQPLTLFNADCLEKMKDISDASVDLIMCDLPYGCLAGPKIGGGQNIRLPENRCAWDIKLNLEEFWVQVKRIRRSDHTPCIHFCTTKFGYDLIQSNPKEFRYDLVWDKQRGVSFLSANKQPMRSHEMIYVFSKAGAFYNRVDISGNFQSWSRTIGGASRQYGGAAITDTEGGDGKRCALSVIKNPKSSTKGGHPTEKPVELYKFLIERYCPPGGTVLDPTFGSANSGQATLELQRMYIGIEKDKGFYDKAVAKFGV
jgi:DNA modification methylase